MAKQTYTEQIICPECKKSQKATVEVGIPWNTQIHECKQCEYIIMESEWEIDTLYGIAELIEKSKLL